MEEENRTMLSLQGGRRRRVAFVAIFAVILSIGIISTSSNSFFITTNKDSTIRHRELRFFDPDHRTCGRDDRDPDKIAHTFATRSLYGASTKDIDDGYYLRRTVSTLQPIPEDLDKVDKILKVLSYVARKTNRPIRVNKKVLTGYNSEAKQGYALVSANTLRTAGVEIVEDLYWARATQAQKVIRSVHEVSLLNNPIQVLQSMGDDMTKLEYGFDIDQLLTIDLDAIGNLVGETGGYVSGQWTLRFNCPYEHDRPEAIRRANDKLAKLW